MDAPAPTAPTSPPGSRSGRPTKHADGEGDRCRAAPRPAEQVRNVALVGHAGAGKTTLAEALLVAHRRAAARRAGRGRHDVPGHRGGRGPPAAVGVAGRRHRRARRPPASTCWTPPARRTSSASCAPACAPPTPPSSSSRPSTAWTPPPWRSGRSARRSACRAPSWSPSSTARGPTSTRPSRLCQRAAGRGRSPAAPGRARPRRRGRRPGRPCSEPPRRAGGRRRTEADRLRGRADRGRSSPRARTRRSWSATSPARSWSQADLIADLETAVARGHFHPVLCAAPLSGVGVAELLDLLVAGLPVPAGARLPAGHPPRRLAGAAADLRPRRPAGRRGRQDHDRPLRRPGLAGPRLLRHAAARHRRSTSPGTAWPTAGHPDHDVDERIGARHLAARHVAAAGRRPAPPATSARSPG